MGQLGERFNYGSVWPPLFLACYCRHLQLCYLLSKEGIAFCVSDLIKPARLCSSAGRTWDWLVPPHKVSTTEAAKQVCPGRN